MGHNLISKEEAIEKLKKYNSRVGKITMKGLKDENEECITYNDVVRIWNSMGNMQRELGFTETGTFHGHSYTKEELIDSIHMFYKEFNTLPTPKLLEYMKSKYPTRKSFEKYFGSVKNAILAAGYEYSKENITQKFVDHKYDDPELLKEIIFKYIGDFNEVPTLKKLNKVYDRNFNNYIDKHFGSWNKCLKFLNIPLNSVGSYTDEELDNAINLFVETYNHTPTIQDFNKTGRPSFWCYQNRFGSWNKAMTHYGYEINDRDNKSTMENGEICASGYEHTISQWLTDNNVSYERNIKYNSFIDNYNGKMDCDYKFTLDDGTIWYVEMAGFLRTYDYKKLNEIEKNYLYKIQYKKKLLKRQNCNYVIITVEDFKSKKLEEIFFFLFNSIKDAI